MDVLEHLLCAAPGGEPVGSVQAWFDRLVGCPFERLIDRALWAGFEADRLGYAFAGGYHAAIHRLLAIAGGGPGATAALPSLATRFSLAATEKGGAHPRAIETVLTQEEGAMRVRGEKTFATLASVADELLVVASRGRGADGKNQLAVVRVRADAGGVTIEDRPPTPFAPEIPHARVTLADVTVRDEDVLPGDGYARYLKPFRTIEDTFVLASALGHVIQTARAHAFDVEVAEGALALAVAVRSIAEADPSDPTAHVALAGLFRAARRLIAEHDAEWEKADAGTRERWRRDLPLLVVADAARDKRTEAAWRALASRA